MICDVKPMKKIRDERVYDAKQVIHIGLNNPESPSAVLDDQWWSDAKTPSQGEKSSRALWSGEDVEMWRCCWLGGMGHVACSSVAAHRRLLCQCSNGLAESATRVASCNS